MENNLNGSRLPLERAIALVNQLSTVDQQVLLAHLMHQVEEQSAAPGKGKEVNQVLVEDEAEFPLGQKMGSASGWKQEKRVLKERSNGSLDVYIEYWFNCELWSVKEQQWKHKSCYVCQHPEGRVPRAGAARKLELLNRQIANKRPYQETLALLNKRHKLEQWESELLSQT